MRARRERRLDRVAIPQAAAELHRDRDRRGDPGDDVEVDRGSPAGAVEVDDVDDRRPSVDPAPGGIDGIRVVGVSRS